ncbi:MAG: protein kinase [Anaerolineae bacterium]|nr:protein kinase [Anaerolineae bacterium]
MIGKTLLNRYHITEHLGDGSTATVYKAVDMRLGRQVALKILLPHVRTTTRSRFFQEARAAAQLNHPNIMAIFDMVEDYEQPFLVVEYVEGSPLADYIPSPPEMVVSLGCQIAMALDYAHERQIIHRDIKPANIQVTPQMQVKIMDLGLALPREATRVTAEGMIIGTPAYLSPEQAQGHTLDHRTDIYSLGIVLYEMATGQLPFDADEISALLLQQVRQPAPPLRLIVPSLPVGLETVILKALEKHPTRRFQSCRLMAEALQEALKGSAVSAQPLSPDAAVKSGDTLTQPSQEVIRLVLADDHSVLRRALVSELNAHAGLNVIGEAADGDGALQKTLELKPDVLVLDLNMPGKSGLDVLPEIRAQAPDVKVLVLTGREESGYIVRALRAGANGYLLKVSEENELVDAIRKVNKGHLVLGHGVTEKVVTGLLRDEQPEKTITETERRVLLLVARGYDNDEVARRLHLAMPLVIETLAGIMDKLGAQDRNEAALLALREGYILLDELHTI